MRHLVISLLICSLVGCAGSPRNTSLKSAKALRSVDTYTLCKAATPRELYTPSQKVLNEVRRRRVNCSSIYSYVSPSEKRKAAKRAAQRLREVWIRRVYLRANSIPNSSTTTSWVIAPRQL